MLIEFYIGDFRPADPDKYIRIDNREINQIASRSLTGKPYIINVKELSLKEVEITAIIENAKNPVVFVFHKKPSFIKTFKAPEYKGRVKITTAPDLTAEVGLFDLIGMILFDKERGKVAETLAGMKSVPYDVILKWILPNIHKIDVGRNVEILNEVDRLTFKADKKYIDALLTAITPSKRPGVIWGFLGKYRFPKKGDAAVDEN